MSVHWRLRSHLSQKHSIYNATSFQKKIIKKTGIIISLPNLCKMINKKPKIIRLETMEVICSALGCELHEFMEVKPKTYKDKEHTKKLSYKNTPHNKRGVKNFPDPKDYN
ncbi:MAG: helix-turn-helix transcriptional regulator [Candidatus Brocadiales bacterium]|nr:helix-turn-helix transcriptional regulator [Candidatus Brocadiales bacterium]